MDILEVLIKKENQKTITHLSCEILFEIFQYIGNQNLKSMKDQIHLALVHRVLLHFYKNYPSMDRILSLNHNKFSNSKKYWDDLKLWNPTIIFIDHKNIRNILSHKYYIPVEILNIRKMIISKNIKTFKDLEKIMVLFSKVEEIFFDYEVKFLEIFIYLDVESPKKLKKHKKSPKKHVSYFHVFNLDFDIDSYLIYDDNHFFDFNEQEIKMEKRKQIIWNGLEEGITKLPEQIKKVFISGYFPYILQSCLNGLGVFYDEI